MLQCTNRFISCDARFATFNSVQIPEIRTNPRRWFLKGAVSVHRVRKIICSVIIGFVAFVTIPGLARSLFAMLCQFWFSPHCMYNSTIYVYNFLYEYQSV